MDAHILNAFPHMHVAAEYFILRQSAEIFFANTLFLPKIRYERFGIAF